MSSSNNKRDPVVASVKNRSPHPYSSVALSPDRSHAIVAGKDALRVISVGPKGLTEIKSICISKHFKTSVASNRGTSRTQSGGKSYGDVRDTFFSEQHPPSPQNITNDAVNVIVTDVAWSLPQNPTAFESNREPSRDNEPPRTPHPADSTPKHSVVAAAGSNGVVVIWNAEKSFLNAGITQNPPSEAVLSQHSRAVNRLAWHPGKKTSLLLTASQDATVKLWERRPSSSKGTRSSTNNGEPSDKQGMGSWFGMHTNFYQEDADQSVTWHCRSTFLPKSEAVRDIQWSPFHSDVFAMVTDSGYLIVYNIHVVARPWVKIAAHSGEATTVDWHPTRPFVIATGGGSDRSVKIWDLESSMSMSMTTKDEKYLAVNSISERSGYSCADSENSNEDTVRAGTMRRNSATNELSRDVDSSAGGMFISPSFGHSSAYGSSSQAYHSIGSSRIKKSGVSKTLHVLSISAAVTRIKWRPPETISDGSSITNDFVHRHDSMLAVATAPISGASAGGNGLLTLWSYHRPFMPLSVMEGHKEGAVTDFIWLDTPYTNGMQSLPYPPKKMSNSADAIADSRRSRKGIMYDYSGIDISGHGKPPLIQTRIQEEKKDVDMMVTIGLWQHALSIGRDGRCLLQSFVRGARPISRVPPSCFAMANLSPFQSGYGSLQVFSVHQSVPSDPKQNYLLTGLRRDSSTALAPGVFREEPIGNAEGDAIEKEGTEKPYIKGVRHPARTPELVFNVIDQGGLDKEAAAPISASTMAPSSITVASEVVHLSRFAHSYKLYPCDEYPTRVDLCLHNANVAESLCYDSSSRMWKMLASVVKGSGLNELPYCAPVNTMGFVLLPTLKLLLEQRADVGDVQTCVAVCEVMQVIRKPKGEEEKESQSTCIPGLELNLVREWYLSYIDLLQEMCLFSHASSLMRLCNDPFIGDLNKKSTTMHESCPHCGKPIIPDGKEFNGRRACKSCRKRVGLCFLCHEPVNEIYVWCPGCGHGGHLDHALQWFGGMNGSPVREVCPTGCGHKCNLVQQGSAFPRTASLLRGGSPMSEISYATQND